MTVVSLGGSKVKMPEVALSLDARLNFYDRVDNTP
tara:strand:+ start:374 stop:478 length:105 start_codon:yes stop_codon:yes gene_type:complete